MAAAEVESLKNAASITDAGWLIILLEELSEVSVMASMKRISDEAHIAHRQRGVPAEVLNT